MNINRKLVNTIIVGLLLILPISVYSHHSGSEFDRETVTELEGTITRVSWRNPHVLMDIETTDENGEPSIWTMEAVAVSAQRRQGVEEGLITEGQQVRVAGWPSTRRTRHMHVNHVLLPNSVELLVGGTRDLRWSETGLGTESWMGIAASTDTPLPTGAGDAEDIFRVWTRETGAWYFRDNSEYPLTEAAALARGDWNEYEDSPLLDCTPPGMPVVMGNPYPMQFVKVDGDMELRFEEFDVVRTIHLGDAANDSDIAPSPLGYSAGHWEKNSLVVNTNKINWPYFNRVGVPQSEAVELVELFTVTTVGDTTRLDYQLTVTDPATLTEPYVWNAYYGVRPGEVVEKYECTLDE
jgi:hypothetical protein